MVIDDAGRAGPVTPRGVILLIHRYSGLVMALFLAITGVTGSVIGFGEEIDAWLNPDLFLASVSGPARKPTELAAATETADPRIRVVGLALSITSGQSLSLKVAPVSTRRAANPLRSISPRSLSIRTLGPSSDVVRMQRVSTDGI